MAAVVERRREGGKAGGCSVLTNSKQCRHLSSKATKDDLCFLAKREMTKLLSKGIKEGGDAKKARLPRLNRSPQPRWLMFFSAIAMVSPMRYGLSSQTSPLPRRASAGLQNSIVPRRPGSQLVLEGIDGAIQPRGAKAKTVRTGHKRSCWAAGVTYRGGKGVRRSSVDFGNG